ncbi:MAG: hypothetical protein VZR00_07405 [Lachnospiraceae bacterium]|nr:hypothetical protein [Lachnospiraceae bacterium]MEE3461693.1 hypothetical protein [Lachnospiraceae bacterium]
MSEQFRNTEDFMEIINDIKTIAYSQNGVLSEKDAADMIDSMDLDDSQKKAIKDYLVQSGIRIEGYDYKAPNAAEQPGAHKKRHHSGVVSLKRETEGIDRKSSALAESLMEAVEDLEQEDLKKKNDLSDHSEEKHRSPAFDAYKEKVSELKTLSQDEKTAYYKRLTDGDSSVVNEIVTRELPLVLSMSSAYMTEKVFYEDVVAEGNLDLLMAVNEICADKETFKTDNGEADIEKIDNYISSSVISGIKDMIEREVDDKDWNAALISKQNLLLQARRYMQKEIGRMPEITELAEYTGMTVQEIEDLDDLVK